MLFLNVIPYYNSSIFNCYLLLVYFSNVNCALLCNWPYIFFCKHINSKGMDFTELFITGEPGQHSRRND